MSFYSMYRIFKDIFKTIFGYKFWRKLLICIIIGVILFFVLHNYGYCAEPDSSYNQITKVGTLQNMSLNGVGDVLSTQYFSIDIYAIDVANTYVVGTSGSSNVSPIHCAVGDSSLNVGDKVNVIGSFELPPNGSQDFTFYNNGYKFLYVSYPSTNRTITCYQQVYSTYLKPLITKTHARTDSWGNLSFDSSGTHYINAFQINKGFNYKVSGISGSVPCYYTSELNQMTAQSAIVNWETHSIYFPYQISITTHTDGETVEPTPGTSQYYNETTSGTITIPSSSIGYDINSIGHTNMNNLGVLPFYDNLTNNQEFTASYTGWLIFTTDNDLTDTLEIWTDYNFYDHDTIYIDNRIQNVNSSVQQGTTEINQSVQDMSNTISDNLTNTNYNQSDVSVNTSTIDNVPNSTDGIFTTIFNNFNNAYSNGVSELIIPLPHGTGSITITSDIVSRHLGNLTALVQAFWLYVFGVYAFRFVNNLIHNIKDGSILDGFKNSNEVITNTMV